MKRLAFALLICVAATNCFAQNTEKEKVVRAFYSGFENHDWNTVVSQFADDFTFTSPANDDHISIEEFKAKCWPTNQFTKRVNFIKTAESGDNLFVLVEITTTDNKLVRNLDFYTFKDGKMKSMECFFGPGEWFPGNKK